MTYSSVIIVGSKSWSDLWHWGLVQCPGSDTEAPSWVLPLVWGKMYLK